MPDELNLEVRADDTAAVYLNGTFIGHTQFHSWSYVVNPTAITVTGTANFVTGINCLEVKAKNLYAVAMGLDIVGFVTGPDSCLDEQHCCNNTAKIQGMKWNDINGDCIKQSNEPVMPNVIIDLYSIYLDPIMSTETDGLGNYYFNDIPPGTYAVTEDHLPPDWESTCPVSGSYTVTLGPNQVVTGLDFGNRQSGQPDVIPTLTEWGIIIFCVLLMGWMAYMLVKRRKRATIGI